MLCARICGTPGDARVFVHAPVQRKKKLPHRLSGACPDLNGEGHAPDLN